MQMVVTVDCTACSCNVKIHIASRHCNFKMAVCEITINGASVLDNHGDQMYGTFLLMFAVIACIL